MEKIGFFGGCFNPPTIAHLELAKNVIEQFNLDKIIFVPMNDFYNKSNLVSSEHRLNMIKLLTKDEKKLEYTDFEIKAHKKLYAIDSFEYIDENYFCEKYFIMGSDNYVKMKDWKDSDKLDKYNYIILDRFHNLENYKNVRIVSNDKFSNISSSMVRCKILLNEDVSEYLVPDVYDYIKLNKLYLEED